MRGKGLARSLIQAAAVAAALFSLVPRVSLGEAFESRCPNLASCVKSVSELLNQKYIFTGELKGSVQSSQNIEINKDNAEFLLSHMLYLNGMTRVPLNQPDTYQIMPLNDARRTLLPVLRGSAASAPFFPNTWDIYELKYAVGYPKVAAKMIRVLRSILPEQSSIVFAETSHHIHVVASLPSLKKAYAILRDMDRVPSGGAQLAGKAGGPGLQPAKASKGE